MAPFLPKTSHEEDEEIDKDLEALVTEIIDAARVELVNE
jgi:hypothetical protein